MTMSVPVGQIEELFFQGRDRSDDRGRTTHVHDGTVGVQVLT